MAGSVPAGTNAMWLKNQHDTILRYMVLLPQPHPTPHTPPTVTAAGISVTTGDGYARGHLQRHHAVPAWLGRPPRVPPLPDEEALHVGAHRACCTTTTTQPTEPPANPIAAAATTLQSTKYIDKIEGVSAAGLTPTNVGTYSVTNTAFTDVFAAHYDEGRASIAPKSSNCKQAPHRTMHRTCTAQSQALRPLRNPRLPTRGGPIPSTRGVRLVEHPSFVSLARSTSCTPRRSTTTGSRAACSASASTRRPPPAHRAHPHFSRARLAVTSPPPSDPAGAQLRCDLNDEVQSLPHV